MQIVKAFVLICIVMILTGCKHDDLLFSRNRLHVEPTDIEDKQFILNENQGEIVKYLRSASDVSAYVYTDPETGIEYLIFKDRNGVAAAVPRLDENGDIIRKENDHDRRDQQNLYD